MFKRILLPILLVGAAFAANAMLTVPPGALQQRTFEPGVKYIVIAGPEWEGRVVHVTDPRDYSLVRRVFPYETDVLWSYVNNMAIDVAQEGLYGKLAKYNRLLEALGWGPKQRNRFIVEKGRAELEKQRRKGAKKAMTEEYQEERRKYLIEKLKEGPKGRKKFFVPTYFATHPQ